MYMCIYIYIMYYHVLSKYEDSLHISTSKCNRKNNIFQNQHPAPVHRPLQMIKDEVHRGIRRFLACYVEPGASTSPPGPDACRNENFEKGMLYHSSQLIGVCV